MVDLAPFFFCLKWGDAFVSRLVGRAGKVAALAASGAVAFAFGRQDVGMVGQSVEQGGGY